MTAIRGDYLFVHAGVRPEVPFEEQQADDLLWIRRPFLTRNNGLPYTVVHGHTLADRHNCETRCYRAGLSRLGGQGAVRGWGSYTNPIPRGFPSPAPL